MAVAQSLNPAESVDRLYTLEEFAELQLEGRVELIDGKVRQMGNNNRVHGELAGDLYFMLRPAISEAGLGKLCVGDISILIDSEKNRCRAADLAFLSSAKVSALGDYSGLDQPPELVIEIVSPSNSWEHVQEKLEDYFSIGVGQVWIVGPVARKIFVHTSPVDVKGYSEKDHAVLDASEIIPDLQLALTDVFANIEQAPSAEDSGD